MNLHLIFLIQTSQKDKRYAFFIIDSLQHGTKWSIMADLRTFKSCYSIKRQLVQPKFCMALVTRYVLSCHQSLINLDCLF